MEESLAFLEDFILKKIESNSTFGNESMIYSDPRVSWEIQDQ